MGHGSMLQHFGVLYTVTFTRSWSPRDHRFLMFQTVSISIFDQELLGILILCKIVVDQFLRTKECSLYVSYTSYMSKFT